MRIFVAIPVYDGKLPAQTVACLLDEKTIASGSGDALHVSLLPDCSVPATGRNQLVQDFLNSDCDRLVFLDADVTFEPGTLLKIAHHPVELVGGAYRYKYPAECYPVMWLGGDLWSDSNGLIEVEAVPGGFLSCSRKVFEQFKEFHSGREFDHHGKPSYAYFQQVFKDGLMHSDDSYFCKEYRSAGGKVYLDPEITLTHWNFKPTPYVGHIGNWIKAQHKLNNTKGNENGQASIIPENGL